MTAYSHTISITVPSSLYDIACAIARALDNDTGGADSFGPRTLIDADGNEYTPETYSTSGPCTAEFYDQAQAMLADPQLLHYAVTQDYAARWPDEVPPTLAECEAFVNGIIQPTGETL